MSKLEAAYELISDKTKNPITSSDYIKHGDKWLDKVIDDMSAFVTPEMFGAVGDGVTDDTAAIQSAIDHCVNGMSLVFSKSCYRMYNRVHINNRHNICIVGANILSTNSDDEESSTTFAIENGSSNITFEKCRFTKGISTIHLFTCNNIKITGCTFEETLYAIIQEDGFVSDNVIISNNHAKNLVGDFIECNCEINAPSKNWVVSDNVYSKDNVPIAYKNESRFIGMTAIENVSITGNIIENVAGNAIHGEDVGGKIILSGNVISNCMGYFVDIEDGSKTIVISNNVFEDKLTKDTFRTNIIKVGGDNFRNSKLIISDNMFYGNGTDNPIDIQNATNNNRTISGNMFYNFGTLFKKYKDGYEIYNITFVNNYVEADKFIDVFSDATKHSTVKNFIINNNKINADIVIQDDGNGSNIPSGIMVENNFINGNINFRNIKDTFFTGNMIGENKTLTITGGQRIVSQNNITIGKQSMKNYSWATLGSKTFANTVADTDEYTGLTITVPEDCLWEVYITASYSNSYTKSIVLSKSSENISLYNGGQMYSGEKITTTPVMILPAGTYYLWVSQQNTSGANVYTVYSKIS